MATVFKYVSGAFTASYDPLPAGSAIDLGTTERGIRMSARPSFLDITEDRYGDTVMDSMFLGIPSVLVTLESLVWRPSAGLENPYLSAPWLQSQTNTSGGETVVTPVDDTKFGSVNVLTLGRSLQGAFAGTLTLTAVTGRLAGTGGSPTPLVVAFSKVVPVDDLDILLSLRGPIRTNFTFRAFPDPTELASTGNLKFWSITTWDNSGTGSSGP